jgi:predicted dehydrogenase
MWSPKVNQTEALKAEAEHFVDCIMHDKKPLNDGEAGLRIVQLLEAASSSMKKQGELIHI